MTGEPLEVALQVTAVLEDLRIRYVIGGSIASSLHGYARLTRDSDIVADVGPQHVQPLIDRLAPHFYIAEEAIREAIEHKSSFNLIHQATLYKVDVFVPKRRSFERSQLRRGIRRTLGTDPPREAVFSSAEDTVLAKLDWYRLGGETSTRQWNDIRNILRVQGDRLDRIYMRQMAAELGVEDLLEKAVAKAT